MHSDYYVSRRHKLLKEFDRVLNRVGQLFVARYGTDAEAALREARQEYEALIPHLPYVGGTQPFTQFLIATAWYLALYRVLSRRGETVEAVGLLIYQASEAYAQTYPRLLRRVLGFMSFSPRYLRRVQKAADKSQERRYPGNYVFDHVPGDGATFDYGVDYIECGPCKFLREQGAAELAAYICPTDIITSRLFGWGLRRTMTLAEGAPRCDFRFKKGGETRVAVPGPLQEYVRRP